MPAVATSPTPGTLADDVCVLGELRSVLSILPAISCLAA